MQKINYLFLFIFIFLCLAYSGAVFAHLPRIAYLQAGDITIINPELSQAFYDELKESPRYYFIDSEKEFELYLNLLVPEEANRDGKYSLNIFLLEGEKPKQVGFIDGASVSWEEYYEPFDRDYYLKGPEFSQKAGAGKYKIEVYSKDNLGKYVLVVGKTEFFDAWSILNIYWQMPFLKLTFFKTSVLQFLFTPFGIAVIGAVGLLLILSALVYYLIGLIKQAIKHNQAKTMLLTSGGMLQMNDEVLKLLQKPAYDVTAAFINTAHKYKLQEDPNYQDRDLTIMKEMGFNVEEVDIEGKNQVQLMRLLELKDIIFVAGGNTFYLLKAMRKCNFEEVIRKLLKFGKVYIGVSAGTIVAGRTIKTAGWKNADKNIVGLKNLKGLNLVPFDIFVHYQPEHAETIKQKIRNPRKRMKKLRILTDDQAILVQGKEVDLIGDGEAVIV